MTFVEGRCRKCGGKVRSEVVESACLEALRALRAGEHGRHLLEATRGLPAADTPPTLLADAGVENVNTRVDELIGSGALRRLLAMTRLEANRAASCETCKHTREAS